MSKEPRLVAPRWERGRPARLSADWRTLPDTNPALREAREKAASR